MGISSNDIIESYSYPGGTFHIASWAAIGTGLLVIGFALLSDGLPIERRLGFSMLSLIGFFTGIVSELSFMNLVGRVEIRKLGIWYTRPWHKVSYLYWEDVSFIRCIWSLPKFGLESWEIQGKSPKDRFIINSELKGYKQLLSSIQQRSPNALFDETPSQQTSR